MIKQRETAVMILRLPINSLHRVYQEIIRKLRHPFFKHTERLHDLTNQLRAIFV